MERKHYWFSVRKDYLESQDVKILDVLSSYRTIKKWALILHDKDVYNDNDELNDPTHKAGTHKPDHYHVYVHFGKQSVNHELVASWFKVNPSSILTIDTTASACLLYFVHGNAESIAKGKYMYDWSEVRHSSNWSPQVLAEQEQYIGHFERFTYKQQFRKIEKVTDTATRVKLKKLLDDAWAFECAKEAFNSERFLQVVFITGASGSGKTTFARQFLEKINYFDFVPKEFWRFKPEDPENPFKTLDYGVSSSKDSDVFGKYLGEEAYILDDLREKVFPFEVLLKILDNHTNSPVPARFCDKYLRCNILVITSTVPLRYWYKDLRYSSNSESLKQLYRRIGTYVEVNTEEIFIYDNIDDKGYPCGEMVVLPNKTYEYYADKPKAIKMQNYMAKLFNADSYESSIDKAFNGGAK